MKSILKNIINSAMYGALALSVALISSQASGQAQPTPYHMTPYTAVSGTFNGHIAETASQETFSSKEEPFEKVSIRTVRADGPWLRLFFKDCELGKNSYLKIRSHKDGAVQRLDATALKNWNNSSAFFNGQAVDVSLHVAPGDKGIHYGIESLMVGDVPDNNGPIQESICGTTDDRRPSNDRATGRLVPVGCTGWIISNGTILTAGHCAGARMQVLQFNVPASNANGVINNPAPEHQYPVIAASVNADDGGVGNDWCVFNCAPNAQTGLLPGERQRAFFRVSRDSNPTNIRITGYGVDGPAPGFGRGPRDATNQTQQTHNGASRGETVTNANRASWNYSTDTQGGNSGSPIIINGTNTTIGIHSHGGCSASGGGNNGTSFENDLIENAVRNIIGTNTVHIDNGDLIAAEDGSAFRPFNTIAEGMGSVPSGGVLSIAPGRYNGAVRITKPMTLRAPVGTVVISSTASRASNPGREEGGFTVEREEAVKSFPNPFTNSISIAYRLDHAAPVSLEIFNIQGQRLKLISVQERTAGSSQLEWDGTDQSDATAPKGVYLYKLHLGDRIHSGKLLKK